MSRILRDINTAWNYRNQGRLAEMMQPPSWETTKPDSAYIVDGSGRRIEFSISKAMSINDFDSFREYLETEAAIKAIM